MSLLSILFGSKYSANDNVKLLTPEEFKVQIANKKVQLIDVRTSKEYSFNHIKGAKNIDFYSGQFVAKFNKLNKNKPVYIYCKSGGRSRQASNKLVDMGFEEIYDLKGGITRWK